MKREKNPSAYTRPIRIRQQRRQGAMLVLIAVLLPVLLFLVAMSVDVGYMQLVRTELRASTDAATRAAGESLSRTQSIDQARQAAKDLAATNLVAGEPLVLEDSDIVFGRSTLQPGGEWKFTPDATPINAVRVNSRRTRDSKSGSVPLLFGRLLGVSQFEPTQSASAVRLDRDICLVVDRSSSMKLSLSSTAEIMSSSDPRFSKPPIMSDSRWGALDDAVRVFVDALDTTPFTEHVGLVSFSSAATWAGFPNTVSDIDQPLDEDTTLITSAMDRISARVFNGMTNTSAGIDNGIVVLTDPSRARPFAVKTMVLLTDGFPTQGRSPVLAAQDAARNDIVVHVITFGADFNRSLMKDLAAIGNGNYYHAPDSATLNQVFREIALSLPVMLTE